MAFFPPDFSQGGSKGSVQTEPASGTFGDISPSNSNEQLIDPSDILLEYCSLVTLDCKLIDLKFVLVELNVYEDLFANHCSGNIVVNDSNNLISNLGLFGYEMIYIRFSKPGTKQVYEKHFRLYKIGDRMNNSLSNETYILYFCSEERILTEQTVVSKCYESTKASEIVSDICGNYLKIPGSRIKIEASKFDYHITVPMKKPIDAIQWIATYTPDHVFYENRDGYHFESLDSLWKKSPKRTYIYGPKNVQSQKDFHVTEIGIELENINSYIFRQNFDVISSLDNGMYSAQLVTVDPLRNKITSYVYEYGKDAPTGRPMTPASNRHQIETGQAGMSKDREISVEEATTGNTKSIIEDPPYEESGTQISSFPAGMSSTEFDNTDDSPESTQAYPMAPSKQKNRLGMEMYKSFGTEMIIAVTTKDHDKDAAIAGRDSDILPNNVEQTTMQRRGRIARLRHVVLEITIPGDPGLLVGDTVTVNLPSVQPQYADKPMMDQYYGGKYLVTAVRHKIQQSSYSCIVELGKYGQTRPMPGDGSCEMLNSFYKG